VFIAGLNIFNGNDVNRAVKREKNAVIANPQAVWVRMVGQLLDVSAVREMCQGLRVVEYLGAHGAILDFNGLLRGFCGPLDRVHGFIIRII
jgi:hypothetical protein